MPPPEIPSNDSEREVRLRGDGKTPDGVARESIQAELEKILGSNTFAHSERLRCFLRYIAEQVSEGHAESLKEYQIGVAVFDRRESFDSRLDPIVRVEARRLRSKLEEYYRTEGKEDPVIIELPKGSYAPVFEGRKKETVAAQGRQHPLVNWQISIVLGAVLVAGVALYRVALLSEENRTLKDKVQAVERARALGPEFDAVWKPFLSPKSQNFIIFGSPTFFAATDARLFFRFLDLNAPIDLPNDPTFQMLQRRFGRLSGPRYDYALMGDARALHALGTFLGRAGSTVTALPANLATWENIREGNVIFIGAPRMDPLLQNLPFRQDFVWDADELVNRNPARGEQERYVSDNHRNKMTYALISSLPGLQKDRRMLLLTTHSAPGTLAAVDYLTRSQSLKEMAERIGLENGEKNYQLLLRVYTDAGNPVRSEYLTHHVLAPE